MNYNFFSTHIEQYRKLTNILRGGKINPIPITITFSVGARLVLKLLIQKSNGQSVLCPFFKKLIQIFL